jgi:hypothetical protein
MLLASWYQRLLRARILNWEATPMRVARPIAGDELVDDAEVVATRAITIDAPPSAIWPWLVQMGVGRGGAYTCDWIERLLGLGMHSAERIVPEFQHLEVGDMPMRPNDPGMRIEILDPERALSSRSEDGAWVWSFALVPTTARRALSAATVRVCARSVSGPEWRRWKSDHWSWSGRCCAASSSGPNKAGR